MNDVRCECGHVNRAGTIICEACGKIIGNHQDENKLLDMRYEGSAKTVANL